MEEEKKIIEKYIIGDTPCVLALSGGPDSMCLLNLLYSLHKNVICVHINHKTRKECEEEYAFVKSPFVSNPNSSIKSQKSFILKITSYSSEMLSLNSPFSPTNSFFFFPSLVAFTENKISQ